MLVSAFALVGIAADPGEIFFKGFLESLVQHGFFLDHFRSVFHWLVLVFLFSRGTLVGDLRLRFAR